MVHLTEGQIRGIDFAVRVTAKSFPFIKGWQFSRYHKMNYSEEFAVIYIDLIVDLEKVGEILDFSISDYWIEQSKKEPLTDLSYLSSISDDAEEKGYADKKLVESDLNINYQNAPKRLKGKDLEKVYWRDTKYVKPISIYYYVTEPTQSEYYEIN